MRTAMLAFACVLCEQVIADAPATLVGLPPGEHVPSAGASARSFSFDWRWLFLIVFVVAASVLLRRFMAQMALRRSPLEAGFLSLCRRLGVTRSERRTLEALSRAHGNASASSLVLCPSAFETAASLVQGSSRPVAKRNIERLRTKLA